MAAGPLLVFGPRSLEYDFGPAHPLTPRRFGPGIELLRWLGAVPGLEPEPASDDEIEWLHAADYVATVREFSDEPHRPPDAGIGPGDDPAFRGMHEAAATVAGGSLRAMEALLRGDAEHAYHPGGGLHHAMRTRASGFCVYNDPALAIVRARREGLRVLYVDLDVHHGDGVQSLLAHDPDVMTVSFHETGRTLFPGTGFVGELGHGSAAGTSVNVPLEPLTGPNAWLAAVRSILPPLAAAFGPDVVVSQHGADSHLWDPLAHLNVTTTAMSAAAQLVDEIAHRYGEGRWLSTGGGGYAIFRVVPRAWALTWLAAAHREPPHHLPEAWIERWGSDAGHFGDAPLPAFFDDDPGLPPVTSGRLAAAERDAATVRLVRVLAVPAILRAAEDEGWWRPAGPGPVPDGGPGGSDGGRPSRSTEPTILDRLTPEAFDRLVLAERVVAPLRVAETRPLLAAALRAGARAVGAVAGDCLVGIALAVPLRRSPLAPPDSAARTDAPDGDAAPERQPLEHVRQLVALGVAPDWRGRGLASRLLSQLAASTAAKGEALVALHTVGERDPIDPLPVVVRRNVAERLFRNAGFRFLPVPREIDEADPHGVLAVHVPRNAPASLVDRIAAAYR